MANMPFVESIVLVLQVEEPIADTERYLECWEVSEFLFLVHPMALSMTKQQGKANLAEKFFAVFGNSKYNI